MKLLSLFFITLAAASTTYPGVRTSIGLNSLNSLLHSYLPDLVEKILVSPLPDAHFYTKFLFVPIKLTLTDFDITKLTFNEALTRISFNNATNQLYLTFSDFSFFIKGTFRYSLPLAITGTFNVSLTDSTVIIPIKLSSDDYGEVKSEVLPLIGNLTTLQINMEPRGFISTTFMVMTHLWPISKIANQMVINVFDSVSTLFNPRLNQFFSSMTYTDRIGTLPIACDYHFYSLTLNPISIEASMNGTFFVINNPGAVSNVPVPSYIPSMISPASVRIQLTEYYFNSIMWGLYTSNSLNLNVKSENIPKAFPYVFTTTGLYKVAPGLVSTYGPNIPIDLQCSVYKMPNFDIQNSVSAYASVYCNFLVRVAPGVSINAFTLIGEFSTNFLATLENKDNSIYLYTSFDSTTTEFSNISVLNSNVGAVNVAKILQASNYFTYYVTVNTNTILSNQGIKLPLPQGVQVKSVNFNIYPGALEIDVEPAFVWN